MHYMHTLRCGEQLKGVVAMMNGCTMYGIALVFFQPYARHNKHVSTVENKSLFTRVRVREGMRYMKVIIGMKSVV